MSKVLYLLDCYLKEWDATVEKANGKYIVLDQTAFYPNAGGQPYDTGKMTTEDGQEYKVVYVGKFSGEVSASGKSDRDGNFSGEIKGEVRYERPFGLRWWKSFFCW